jgi:hypothetical protein
MESKANTWVTRFIAVVLSLLILLVSVVITYAGVTLVPYLSGLWWRDVAGISVDQTITLGSFRATDFMVLMMVWFLPSLVIVGVILMVLKKIYHIAWRYLKQVLYRAFAKKQESATNGKEQTQDEHSVTG